MNTWIVVLDYCGGERTDSLVSALRSWNPTFTINVLDNASPDRLCRGVTHRNAENSFVGGGIRDCIQLAQNEGADSVMFIANDVECVTPLDISHFAGIVRDDDSVVHVSAAITDDSAQARPFPWMVDCGRNQIRAVGHADILVSLLRLDFVRSFGGFPKSKSGWGYSWEVALHASLQSRRIVVTDRVVVRHRYTADEQPGHPAWDRKHREMADVYGARYGGVPWNALRAACLAPYRTPAGAVPRVQQTQKVASLVGTAFALGSKYVSSAARYVRLRG